MNHQPLLRSHAAFWTHLFHGFHFVEVRGEWGNELRKSPVCLGTSCKWEGPLEDILNHLLTAHKTITTLGGEDNVFLVTDIHLPGAVLTEWSSNALSTTTSCWFWKTGETRGTPAVLRRRSVDRDGEWGPTSLSGVLVCVGVQSCNWILLSLSLFSPYLHPSVFSLYS